MEAGGRGCNCLTLIDTEGVRESYRTICKAKAKIEDLTNFFGKCN